jgi:hypothetical protein
MTAVNVSVLVFGVVTPCGPLSRNRRFGETFCLQLKAEDLSPENVYFQVQAASLTTRSTRTLNVLVTDTATWQNSLSCDGLPVHEVLFAAVTCI